MRVRTTMTLTLALAMLSAATPATAESPQAEERVLEALGDLPPGLAARPQDTEHEVSGTTELVELTADEGELTVAVEDAEAVPLDDGEVTVSETANASVDTAVVPTAEGVQLLTVINDASAPQAYNYTFEGTALELDEDDGSVVVSDGEEVLAIVEAPWVMDADGRSMATSFTVDGDTLTQHVDHEGASYPVVADPRISLGWYYYVRWSRTEVRRIASNYFSWTALSVAVCATIWYPGLRAACTAYVATYAYRMYDTFKTARRYNQCVEARFGTSMPFFLHRLRRYSTSPTCHS